MKVNVNAIVSQLKENPEFIEEVCANMADALCILVSHADDQHNKSDDKADIISKASQLAHDRMVLRDFIR